MRFSRVMTVVLLLLAGACTAAFAKDVFVATNGNDTTGDGTITKPYATLTKATSVAVAGDNINMRAGTYVQHRYWDSGGDGAAGQYITISAYDGDLSVVFQADNTGMDAICFHARHYIKLIGLEVKQGSNIVHADGGSQYIYIQRCYIHDASLEGDCIKVNQCDYVYVEDNEVAVPGDRSGGGSQEGIDFVDVDFSAQRDNYVRDFKDMALYTKGGSENNIIERNVISNQTTTYGNPATGFGQQTDSNLMDGATYQSYNCVYRNNIIRASAMGAIGTYDCYHGYFYHNTVYNCGNSTHGIVHQRPSTTKETPKTTGVYFFNNVFLDTAGDMWTVYENRSGTYEDWQTGNNNYYNNGSPIPSSGIVNPNTESGATFGNPTLSNPTGTATTWQGWVDCYRITSSSAALIDHGNTSAGNSPYPAVSADIEGVSRPQGSGYDIGAFEYGSGPVPPVANFTGNPTSGTAPLTVAFTDTSTGSPTSWSWTFGDGGTSTAQSPSHVYNTVNSYTVSLTATNAQGSDSETKSNYITVSVASTPTFVAAGSVASGTGTITPALPAGIASNDILLLFVETANQACSISNQNGGTWTAVTNSPQYTGTAGGTAATRLTVFWSRYNGTQGAPTVSDSGNHQIGRMVALRGATTSGNPWDVTAGGVEATADTSGAIPGATTTVDKCLVVAAIATALPDATGTANFSAWANANLTSVTERTDNTANAGNGGGLAIATGEKATAGVYGSTTVTCGSSTTKGMLSIAIKP